MSAIRLIAGLGNPGPRFEGTRHNVGAYFVEALARRYAIALKEEPKFKALIGRGEVAGHDVRLLIPTTYMNLSGESVGAVASFYKLASTEILVAYDEMAFAVGVVRLKIGGGHNGHNGLIDVIQGLGNDAGFVRLRIGVDHPGHPDLVTPFLTGTRMPSDERERIEAVLDLPDDVLADLVAGNTQKAMNALHAPTQDPSQDSSQNNEPEDEKDN